MITSIRYKTFASNSSSTHSLIITTDPLIEKQSKPLGRKTFFGWDWFTLISPESKKAYIASVLATNLAPLIGDELSLEVSAKLLGISNKSVGFIDHQSVPGFPRYFHARDGINFEFIKEYKDYLLKNSIVILGGNDNEGNHPLVEKYSSFVLPLFYDSYGDSNIISRKDKKGFWVLFDKYSGTKIRVDFNDEKGIASTEKASVPELVDIKITDYCPFQCHFCYTGSTKTGNHGDYEYIKKTLLFLSELEVFEVAFGGGEPTLHPDFQKIINFCYSVGITPNFTTKNISWLDDNFKACEILLKCGSYAYSVRTVLELRRFITYLKNLQFRLEESGHFHVIPKTKVFYPTIHIIEHILPEHELSSTLEICSQYHLPVVLLGLKSTFRGEVYKEKINKKYNWIPILQEFKENNKFLRFSIDTVIAQKYEEELKNLEIPELVYTKKEGAFSCFIDAVEKKIGPSSFCEVKEYRDLPDNEIHNIKTYFKNF